MVQRRADHSDSEGGWRGQTGIGDLPGLRRIGAVGISLEIEVSRHGCGRTALSWSTSVPP